MTCTHTPAPKVPHSIAVQVLTDVHEGRIDPADASDHLDHLIAEHRRAEVIEVERRRRARHGSIRRHPSALGLDDAGLDQVLAALDARLDA